MQNFSLFQSFVADLWNFLFFPTVCIVAVLLILRLQTPSLFDGLFAALRRSRFVFVTSEAFQKNYGFYQFPNYTPMMVLLLTLSGFFVVNAVVLGVGNLLPGRLVVDPVNLMMVAHDPDQLANICARTPEAKTYPQLAALLSERLDSIDSNRPVMREVAKRRIVVQRNAIAMSLLKVLILMSLVLVPFALRRQDPAGLLMRTAAVLAVLLVLLGCAAVNQAYTFFKQGVAEQRALVWEYSRAGGVAMPSNPEQQSAWLSYMATVSKSVGGVELSTFASTEPPKERVEEYVKAIKALRNRLVQAPRWYRIDWEPDFAF